eukprot:TRINITY_DN3333_c0_g1_i3.p3 TRINITY_DN3333_c0_g1~~TRINITY_DN3333_c0_g1_i3.p3  ORF type:complete len:116 (-),score=30.70 TRINITY_DN3333_c0_g1_i3:361-708(-)
MYASMKKHMGRWQDGGGVFIVIGEQDTERSASLYFVMWRLALEGVTTVVYDAKDREYPVVFTADAAREGPYDAPVFMDAFKKHTTWIVLTTSPEESKWKHVNKRDDAELAHMPPQ